MIQSAAAANAYPSTPQDAFSRLFTSGFNNTAATRYPGFAYAAATQQPEFKPPSTQQSR
jgi:hypothetical protein